jgi:vancomycin resistance protein VanW
MSALVPFGVRVACHRAARHVHWWLRPLRWATERVDPADAGGVVAERTSPLRRAIPSPGPLYTDEKIHNLRLAAARVQGLRIAPGEVFSFCRTVGKTTRARGYVPALELRGEKLITSLGGALCQLSNLLFLVALDVNAEIVERHRHGFDLFRDTDRTVPFGCGATVFYNYVDLQFRNTLASAITLDVRVEEHALRAAARSQAALPFSVRVHETDHRYFRDGPHVYRSNRVWREVSRAGGTEPTVELLFENTCRVLYPADDLVDRSEAR